MLYICILSNKFDLKQTIRVLHNRFIVKSTCYCNSLTFHKPFLALAKQIQRIRPFFFFVILVVFIQIPSVAMLIGFPFTIYREIILRTSNSL